MRVKFEKPKPAVMFSNIHQAEVFRAGRGVIYMKTSVFAEVNAVRLEDGELVRFADNISIERLPNAILFLEGE